jgi:hypothetical protein
VGVRCHLPPFDIISVGEHDKLENMTWEHDRNERWERCDSICAYVLPYHIVYFYIRTSENLLNVGSSRHKLPRHLQFCVGDTDPSGQNWSDTSCRADISRHVGDISS